MADLHRSHGRPSSCPRYKEKMLSPEISSVTALALSTFWSRQLPEEKEYYSCRREQTKNKLATAVPLVTVVICSSWTVTDYHDYQDGGQEPDLHQLIRF